MTRLVGRTPSPPIGSVRRMRWHLAQINVATLRAPMDDPLIADFAVRTRPGERGRRGRARLRLAPGRRQRQRHVDPRVRRPADDRQPHGVGVDRVAARLRLPRAAPRLPPPPGASGSTRNGRRRRCGGSPPDRCRRSATRCAGWRSSTGSGRRRTRSAWVSTSPASASPARRWTIPAAGRLIERLDAELAAMYPEPGANHFTLTPSQVADGAGGFVVAHLDGTAVGVRCVPDDRARRGRDQADVRRSRRCAAIKLGAAIARHARGGGDRRRRHPAGAGDRHPAARRARRCTSASASPRRRHGASTATPPTRRSAWPNPADLDDRVTIGT